MFQINPRMRFVLAGLTGLFVSNASFALIGNGNPLTITDGDSFDYGDVPVNTPEDHVFTIVNNNTIKGVFHSNDPLLPPFGFKGGSFPGTGGTCTGTGLNPGDSCTFVITFEPTAVGSYNEPLNITYYFVPAVMKRILNMPQISADLTGNGVVP